MTPITTITTIKELAEQYLADANYHRGIITGEWIEKVSNALNLKNITNLELSDMWDMVYLTLDGEIDRYEECNDLKNVFKYIDVRSAFIEVVNAEARKRK